MSRTVPIAFVLFLCLGGCGGDGAEPDGGTPPATTADASGGAPSADDVRLAADYGGTVEVEQIGRGRMEVTFGDPAGAEGEIWIYNPAAPSPDEGTLMRTEVTGSLSGDALTLSAPEQFTDNFGCTINDLTFTFSVNESADRLEIEGNAGTADCPDQEPGSPIVITGGVSAGR